MEYRANIKATNMAKAGRQKIHVAVCVLYFLQLQRNPVSRVEPHKKTYHVDPPVSREES